MVISAILTGYSIYEYVTDSEIQAQSQIEPSEISLEGDVVYFQLLMRVLKREAIGSELEYHTDNYPDVNRYFLNPEDLNNQISNLKTIPRYEIHREECPASIKCVEDLKGKSRERTLFKKSYFGAFYLGNTII